MRRVGLVLVGLGVFFIVFALLIPTWVSGRVIKFPLNLYVSVNLTDSNASYFSPAKLAEQTGVTVEATQTIKGNAAAGSSSTAVWNQFTYIYDQTNKLPIQQTSRTMAFDRRTAQLVNCCGANVNGDSSVKQSGYVGIVLPIGTEKKTYPVFVPDVKKTVPFAYAGIDAVGGTEAYRFVANIPPTQNGTQTVPGSLVNQSASSVTLPQFFQAQITYWIDPVTGALLNVTENQKLTLRDSTGAQALLLFDANLVATTASVDRLLAIDNNQVSRASFVNTLLPLLSAMVGLILLVVGFLVGRRPRQDAEAAPSARSPELAAAESAEDAGRAGADASLVPGLDDEPREAAQPEAAQAEKAEGEKAEAEAAKPEASAAAEEAPKAEAPAEPAKAEAAAEANGEAKPETPAAEAAGNEAPTAEIPAATAEQADPSEAETAEQADTAEADGGPAAKPRRGGAHRR
jgi:cell division protein FtsN